MDFVKQREWDTSYEVINLDISDLNDSIVNFIVNRIPTTTTKDVFEIGCFPGRYLNVFGEKGYELNGVDLTPRVLELNDFFLKRGYKVGQIQKEDFQKLKTRKYDLVCSFGFIEHYKKFIEIIDMHSGILKENGTLLITAPNFRGGLQYIYHKILDDKNLKKHNLKSMSPRKWEQHLIDCGFQIIYCGYIGSELWKENYNSKNNSFKIFERILTVMIKFMNSKFPNNSFSSAYCVILAKKTVC